MNTTSIIAISVAVVLAAILAVTLLGEDEPGRSPPPVQPSLEEPVVEPEAVAPGNVAPPSFDVVRISREGTGVIAGRSAPEAFVEVLADGEPIGRVRANRDGEWVLIFDDPLHPGTRELTLSATLGANPPVGSTDVVVVAVPEPTDPGFESGADGVVAVLASRDGRGTSRVLQRPGALQPTIELGIDTVDFDETGKATFSGFAPAGSEVRFYMDNQFVASVVANDAGRWSVAPDDPIAPGEHLLRLDQIIEGDAVELRVEQPFDAASALNIALAEKSVLIQPGNNLWNIARRVYGHGVLYTQIFQANEAAILDPDLIFPGQRFVLPRAEEPEGAE